MSRSPARRLTRKDLAGVALALIAGSFVLLLGSIAVHVRRAALERPCGELADPEAQLVVLVDKTDPYTESQRDRIRTRIEEEIESMDAGSGVSIFILDSRGLLDNDPSFESCRRERGEDVNALYRNPAGEEYRYTHEFREPLDRALDELLEPGTAKNSPILESLLRLSQTDRLNGSASRRRVILFSDLMQNSAALTFYGDDEIDVDAAAEVASTYGADLDGVELAVYLIPRERIEVRQMYVWTRVWPDLVHLLRGEWYSSGRL